jgi:hypothetical protein
MNIKQELYKRNLKKLKANSRILFSNKTFYFNGIDNYDDILIKDNLKKIKNCLNFI